MLEEPEFAKKKPVKAGHIIELVECENENKPQEKLPECKAASETVPDRDDADACDRQQAEYHQRPRKTFQDPPV